MKILFVRHGQASYGTANYDRLSPLGHQQAKSLGRYLSQKYPAIDEVYVGLLQRQQHTLDNISRVFTEANIHIPDRINTSALNEFHGPRVLARVMSDLIERDPIVKQWSEAMAQDPDKFMFYSLKIFEHVMEEWAIGNLKDLQPDEYDDWATFHERASSWLEGFSTNYQVKKGKTILAVTSGGTISSMLGIVKQLEDPRKIVQHIGPILNTSITEVVIGEDHKTLVSFNDTSHLEESFKTFV